MWVLSHVVISGNETADKLANEASLHQNTTKLNLTTSSESLNIINLKILETWQKNWSNVPLSNKLKTIKPHIKK